MSDSVRPYRQQPTRLRHPWEFLARVVEWVASAFSWRISRSIHIAANGSLSFFSWLDNTAVFFNWNVAFCRMDSHHVFKSSPITGNTSYFQFFFQLQCVCCRCCCCLVTKSYPALRDSVDCSLPGSSVHGILQIRTQEWVAVSFFKRSSQPRD